MSIKKLNSILLIGAFSSALTLSPAFSFAGEIEDTAITAEVKLKLAAEKDIPAQNIEVTTQDNVVSLRGVLDTHLQVNRAIEIASSLDNVNDVISSDLTSKGSESYLADAAITAKVKGKIRYLFNHKKIGPNYDLHVETTDGVVHIFGKVNKPADSTTILNAVKGIKGVKSVRTNVVNY